MTDHSHFHPETKAVALGRPPHIPGAPVNYPIGLSTTFVVGDEGHGYVREGTLGTEALEQAIGGLEGGHTVVYSSGISTVNAVADILPPHAVVVVPNHSYPGTLGRFRELAAVDRVVVREVLISDTAAVEAACDGADLVWLESPTNPLMEVADIRRGAAAAHANGALAVVDNTFMSPARQRPLDLGADLSMHSATKSIAGHSDSLLGCLTTRDEALAERLRVRRAMQGTMPGALETFLALRGLRTMHLRVDRAEANAMEIARRLTSHARVDHVYYPGLPDDPGHDLHLSQARGAGAVVCFTYRGTVAETEAINTAVRLWTPATSLGGVESTLERRRRWPAESPDTPETLVRLSVGIEHVEDLWSDLDRALNG